MKWDWTLRELKHESHLHSPWVWPQQRDPYSRHIACRWPLAYRHTDPSPAHSPGWPNPLRSSRRGNRCRCLKACRSVPTSRKQRKVEKLTYRANLVWRIDWNFYMWYNENKKWEFVIDTNFFLSQTTTTKIMQINPNLPGLFCELKFLGGGPLGPPPKISTMDGPINLKIGTDTE